jgi:hypothetical protein
MRSRLRRARRRAGRAVGAAAVLVAVLTACGDTGATATDSGRVGESGGTESVKTTSISPEYAGRPPAALLEDYGVSLPEGAKDIHYREVRPRSGGTLYVRMSVPDAAAREWLTALGGSPSDLKEGWNPVISNELRESGWQITASDSLFGAWIPVAESGPETDKKVVIVENASKTADVYLVTNL